MDDDMMKTYGNIKEVQTYFGAPPMVPIARIVITRTIVCIMYF